MFAFVNVIVVVVVTAREDVRKASDVHHDRCCTVGSVVLVEVDSFCTVLLFF